MEAKTNPDTIDDYIAQFSPEMQERLQALRTAILEAAPGAGEKISWNMPTFTLNGNLVHFAAHKNHIGLYPGPSGIEKFKNKLVNIKIQKARSSFPAISPAP